MCHKLQLALLRNRLKCDSFPLTINNAQTHSFLKQEKGLVAAFRAAAAADVGFELIIGF